MANKLTSRKFWVAVAAFLGSFGIGVTGLVIGDIDLTKVGAMCGVASASIYAAAEAYVDGKNAASSTVSITASTTAKEVVEGALANATEN